MKSRLIVLIAVMFSSATVFTQSVNFRFSNYFYSWQRIDSLSTNSNAKTIHIRGYQNYLLEIKSNKWSFNTLAQTEEDLTNRTGRGFAYRFYNLYVKGSDLFNGLLDVKLGRQTIFAGAGKGSLDGLNLKIKAGKNKEYQLTVYGGYPASNLYEFKKYPKLKDNYFIGGQFTYYGVKDLMAAISYVNRHREIQSYTANRLDSLYNTTTREITVDSPADQIAGLDLSYSYLQKYYFFGKAYVDVNRKKFYRADFNAKLILPNNIGFFAGYFYREPMISYNSIFWVFEHKPNQEVEGGIDYTLKNGINIYGKVAVTLYDNAKSFRIQAGFTHPMYGISFTRYMKYAGESDGISGYYQRQILKDILSTSVSVSYSRYRIGDYTADKVNSLSGALGFTYRPLTYFSVDAQGQLMINRIYKTDARFLIGLNYWLFKKL